MHLRNRYFLLVISSKTIKNRLQFICKIGILTRACCSYFPLHDILSLDLVATLFFNNLAFSNHVLTVEKHSLKKGKYKPFKIFHCCKFTMETANRSTVFIAYKAYIISFCNIKFNQLSCF